MRQGMMLEVLHIPDCPNLGPMLERLQDVTDLPVATRTISTTVEALAQGMAGSPTLLVNGVDPFADGRTENSVSCRIYRDERGRMVPVPSREQLRAAVSIDGPSLDMATIRSTDVMCAWRIRATPLEADETAVLQAILRRFVARGIAPSRADLSVVTPEGSRPIGDILSALHRADAIRLAPDGRIAVAYPFSARSTRHRVRIADQVDVFAMCAIDALGIAPMLATDTVITSDDRTNGRPVTVTTIDGRTTWSPATAVTVIGAVPGGGSSADTCCEYLNFFTDTESANAWLTSHPHVPGEVLTQREAEALADRLYSDLLAG